MSRRAEQHLSADKERVVGRPLYLPLTLKDRMANVAVPIGLFQGNRLPMGLIVRGIGVRSTRHHAFIYVPYQHSRSRDKGVVFLHRYPHALFYGDLIGVDPHLLRVFVLYNAALPALLPVLQQEVFARVNGYAHGLGEIAAAISRQQR